MKLRVLLIGLLLMAQPTFALAGEVTIRPFLVDKTMVPRESAVETIRLENNYEFRKTVIFATVNEITVGTDGEIREFVSPVMTDRTTTVTSWIEIGRGRIEIMPGEVADIPLTINVHPYAEPGEYHVFVGFVEARNRPLAEKQALNNDAPGVIVKVTVADERVDTMRVASLQVDRFVTDPDEQMVEVTVENPGELPSAPEGELIFYNSRGIEVASTNVNEEKIVIPPGAERTFSVAVPFDDDLGRYKANLNMRYGANQQASLYDTTTFFMMPIWYLLAFGVGILLLVFVLILLFRRALSTNEVSEHGDDVAMFVRDGHTPNPQSHDIDLTDKK